MSTYKYFELIIVDDCSTDNTVDIIKELAVKDSRIRYFINTHNLGDYQNRNKAVSYAQGEYFMFVDSDDLILKDGIERCLDTMQKFPDSGIGFYYANSKTDSPYSIQPEEIFKKHFFDDPILIVGPGGTIVKREYFIEIHGYPELYGPANDMYFNLNAAANTAIVIIPFLFNYYRIHAGQEQNNQYSYLYNNYNYLNDALRKLKLNLEPHQIEFLLNKNKRRFVVNSFFFLLKEKNIFKLNLAIKNAKFGIFDLCRALYH